ncbi:MAG: class I SAM-dependent methyltransferase [Planctomycetota bacterium]
MEESAYQQFADLEEDHFWFRGRRAIFFSLLDRWIGRRDDLQVLEIGCGAGGMLRRLAGYGNASGLELSHELAVLAHERSGRPTICATAYGVPLPADSQDLICLFDTLEHIPDERQALEEVQRVLRPGGLAFFSVPAYQFLYAHNDRVSHHCRRYTKGRLRAMLGELGFDVVKLSYFNTLLFPLILPAVLLQKLRERLFGVRDTARTNLSIRFPGPLNSLLALVMGSERHLLRHLSFPLGHSLLGIFRKPG